MSPPPPGQGPDLNAVCAAAGASTTHSRVGGGALGQAGTGWGGGEEEGTEVGGQGVAGGGGQERGGEGWGGGIFAGGQEGRVAGASQ